MTYFQPSPKFIEHSLEEIAAASEAERISKNLSILSRCSACTVRLLARRQGIPCSEYGQISQATYGAIARLM